jgi:cysteinylglycine-S-conjugate dipeptidase
MAEDLRAKVRQLMPAAREDLARLVAFRSVADPKQAPPEECERAAAYVMDAFAAVGLEEVRAYDTPDGSKSVLGRADGPPGAPTVLLYCHHDVQPSLDEDAWATQPFELTERNGRWYGRGAADCKGNIAAHLTALRALQPRWPVSIKVVSEGSEEQGTGGLEQLMRDEPELLRADAVVIADAGNVAAGLPTLTTTLRGIVHVVVTVETLASAVHSGMFGGPAPDALTALIGMLSTLHDAAGNTTVRGLDNRQRWAGADYPEERFRRDATVLDGVRLLGDGSVADMLWARPALTVLGIDCPPVVGSSAAVQARARARLSMRVPPGMDAFAARDALVGHLSGVAPWNVRVELETEAIGQPFASSTDGPAFRAMADAMGEAYGRAATTRGEGAAIPLCSALREVYPDAEVMLIGVEEPACLIHAPNESVDPSEIEHIALAEALFLGRYGS